MFKVGDQVMFKRNTYTSHRTVSGTVTQDMGDGSYRVRANGSGMYASVYVLKADEMQVL